MTNINDIRLRFLAIARIITGKEGYISAPSHWMKPMGSGRTDRNIGKGDPNSEED